MTDEEAEQAAWERYDGNARVNPGQERSGFNGGFHAGLAYARSLQSQRAEAPLEAENELLRCLVVDAMKGWSTTPTWQRWQREARAALDRAEPQREGKDSGSGLDGTDARTANALKPGDGQPEPDLIRAVVRAEIARVARRAREEQMRQMRVQYSSDALHMLTWAAESEPER